MADRKIALKLLMDKLELGTSDFDQRLILQKTIYLLQHVGLDLGYRYNWYIHGPYAPMLTEDAFDISGNKTYYDKLVRKSSLSEDAMRRVKNFKSQFGDYLNKAKMLELLASLLYLGDRQGRSYARSKIREFKPTFTQSNVREATHALRWPSKKRVRRKD